MSGYGSLFQNCSAYYTGFKNSSGLIDVISGNIGVISGSPSYATDKFGISRGLTLDGSTQYVKILDSAAWTLGSNPFTIILHLQITVSALTARNAYLAAQNNATHAASSTSFSGMIYGGQSGTDSYKYMFGVCNTAPTWFGITSTNGYNNSNEHIIMLIRRSDGYLYLYVDGVSAASPVTVNGTINDSSNNIGFGCPGDSNQGSGGLPLNPLPGNIYALILLKGYALSTSEISAMYKLLTTRVINDPFDCRCYHK